MGNAWLLVVTYSQVGDLWGKWAVNSSMCLLIINLLIFIPTSLVLLLKLDILMFQHSLRFVKVERLNSQRPSPVSFFPIHSLRGIPGMFYLVSAIITSCKSIVHHSQDTDIGTPTDFILISLLLMHLGVCVCLFLCNFITNIDSFIYDQSRNRTISSPQKCLLLQRHTYFHPTPNPIPNPMATTNLFYLQFCHLKMVL